MDAVPGVCECPGPTCGLLLDDAMRNLSGPKPIRVPGTGTPRNAHPFDFAMLPST